MYKFWAGTANGIEGFTLISREVRSLFAQVNVPVPPNFPVSKTMFVGYTSNDESWIQPLSRTYSRTVQDIIATCYPVISTPIGDPFINDWTINDNAKDLSAQYFIGYSTYDRTSIRLSRQKTAFSDLCVSALGLIHKDMSWTRNVTADLSAILRIYSATTTSDLLSIAHGHCTTTYDLLAVIKTLSAIQTSDLYMSSGGHYPESLYALTGGHYPESLYAETRSWAASDLRGFIRTQITDIQELFSISGGHYPESLYATIDNHPSEGFYAIIQSWGHGVKNLLSKISGHLPAKLFAKSVPIPPVNLYAYIKVIGITNLYATITPIEAAKLKAWVTITQIRDLKAKTRSFHASFLSSIINGHLAANLPVTYHLIQKRTLHARIRSFGSAIKDLTVSIRGHGHGTSDMYTYCKSIHHAISDLMASGIPTGPILHARIAAYHPLDLMAKSGGHLPVNLYAISHSYITSSMPAFALGSYIGNDDVRNIRDLNTFAYASGGYSSLISHVTILDASYRHNLHAYIQSLHTTILSAYASSSGGYTLLNALANPTGGYSSLVASAAAKVLVLIESILINTMSIRDLRAFVRTSCCSGGTGHASFRATSKAQQKSDLRAYARNNFFTSNLSAKTNSYDNVIKVTNIGIDVQPAIFNSQRGVSINYFNVDVSPQRFNVLHASATPAMLHSDLMASIKVLVPDIIKLPSFAGIEWYDFAKSKSKNITLKFLTQSYRYIYSSAEKAISSGDGGKWVIEVTCASDMGSFGTSDAKRSYVFNLKEFKDLDEAVKFAIQKITGTFSYDLYAIASARGGLSVLSAKAIPTTRNMYSKLLSTATAI